MVAACVWLAAATTSLGSGGCDPECDPVSEVVLVAPEQDPNRGAFEGTLTWLQTGEDTTLRVSVTTEANSATRSCGPAVVQMALTAETTDGVLLGSRQMDGYVSNEGRFEAGYRGLPLDLVTLGRSGKLTDAPGIEDRNATARLDLAPESDGTWSATVVVQSPSDRLTVGMATLTRTGP
jgi:hypothetical protein